MELQPGDIAACYGTDRASRVITWGTASLFGPRRLRLGPSHVAMVFEHRGAPVWGESTTLCRHECIVQGRRVSGCQGHIPENRVQDYCSAGGRVDVYRLSPIDSLSRRESELLTKILLRHFIGSGVAYNLGGALISGTRVLKLSRLLPGYDRHRQFCSELLAAVLMRLGRLNRGNATRYNPAGLLRELVRQGTYQYVATPHVPPLRIFDPAGGPCPSGLEQAARLVSRVAPLWARRAS